MPSDDVLVAAVVFTALGIGIGFYVRRWASSVSRRLKSFSESAAILESKMLAVRSDVGDLTRLLSDKIGSIEADAMVAAFVTQPVGRRKKMVVKFRG